MFFFTVMRVRDSFGKYNSEAYMYTYTTHMQISMNFHTFRIPLAHENILIIEHEPTYMHTLALSHTCT